MIFNNFICEVARKGRRSPYLIFRGFFDPRGQPTVMAGSDHCFCTCRPFVRRYVCPHFSKQNKFQVKTMFATGETVSQAEWIIDEICLVFLSFSYLTKFSLFMHTKQFSLQYNIFHLTFYLMRKSIIEQLHSREYCKEFFIFNSNFAVNSI